MNSHKYLSNFCPALYGHMPGKGAPPGCLTQNRWSLPIRGWSHQCSPHQHPPCSPSAPLPHAKPPAALKTTNDPSKNQNHSVVSGRPRRAGLRWKGRGRFGSRRNLVERSGKSVGEPASPRIRVAGSAASGRGLGRPEAGSGPCSLPV